MTTRDKIENIEMFLRDAKEAYTDPMYKAMDPIGHSCIPGQIREGERQLARLNAKWEAEANLITEAQCIADGLECAD